MAELSRRCWLQAAAASLLVGACKSAAPSGDGTILGPYLDIGETLAGDSVDELGRLGAVVVEAASAREGQAGVDEILAAAGRVGSPDIATARLAYRKMSEGVIAWLAANPDQRQGLELLHCPMAFTNQGAYWVQRQGEIANPYEGAMMLRCGAKIAWDDYRRGAAPAGEAVVSGMETP